MCVWAVGNKWDLRVCGLDGVPVKSSRQNEEPLGVPRCVQYNCSMCVIQCFCAPLQQAGVQQAGVHANHTQCCGIFTMVYYVL